MLCNATLRSTSHCITCINICQMLIQFEIFSGDELNKPMASVQILLLLYTTYSMYITCVIEIKYVYTKSHVVTPHLNRLDETVQMRDHNMFLYRIKKKLSLSIIKYSLLSRALLSTLG